MLLPSYHAKTCCHVVALLLFFSCDNHPAAPSREAINQINLKKGNVISCGPADKQFGSVDFAVTGTRQTKQDFNLAVSLLHSFEYDEAEKMFAKIIDQEPSCAMAYWGVAMCNFHALWTPPSEPELIKGNGAIAIAKSIRNKSARESAYINALGDFYTEWQAVDHAGRCLRYEQAMEKVHSTYPDDKEAAIFYALALDAAAAPTDKTFTKQKKAGAILRSLYPSEPNHPGIIHYIIHTYDYPGLADSALDAARRYAQVAPSSAHALHMPSHIFTRLGLWDECIKSNLASIASAKCYAEQAGIKGHWDEELHGLDYLVYAYLQTGENTRANEQLNYLNGITDVSPVNFKVAYAFAAIPARIALEQKNWTAAANLKLIPANFPWTKFPWQESIIHFARVLGAIHSGNSHLAASELARLKVLRDTLILQHDAYKAKQVAIQVNSAEAWMKFTWADPRAGLVEMQLAADMEDSTGKHPVTPGEVLPARELLADMQFEARQYAKALLSYEAVLQKSPKRLNALTGAATSANKLGKFEKANLYSSQLPNVNDQVLLMR